MAVVAILSILLVLAVSVYADYALRDRIAEAMGLTAQAKVKVSEYYYNHRDMPRSNIQAGLPAPAEYDKFNFIRALELSTAYPYGIITITFKLPGTKADRKQLQLTPTTSEGIVHWQCIVPTENGIDDAQVPPSCRG